MDCAPHFSDRDEHVVSRADVGILREKPAIDDDRCQLDVQPAAMRHPLASIARDVDEDSLHALRLHIDVQGGRRFRQHELDVVTGHSLQHRLQIAEYPLQVYRPERHGLLVAIDGELSKETRRAGDFAEEHFTLMSQDRVVMDGREPLLAVLAHISKQVVAGGGHLRRETSDRFHLMRPAEPFFELADFRDVLDDDFDRVSRRGNADQLHDDTAAVFPPPRGLDGFCRAGVETALDQPMQIVRGLEDRFRKIHLPQFVASAVAE